ncbi:hypothetical protein B0T13DRAFT_472063 [Neurospora crassa]|nr:hypothetical protein B0T13DRAFT_472063 [Neurospora crassa]
MIRSLLRPSPNPSHPSSAARCLFAGASSHTSTTHERLRRGFHNSPAWHNQSQRSPSSKTVIRCDRYDKVMRKGYAVSSIEKNHSNRTVSQPATGLETYDVEDWWEKWHPIARAETKPPCIFRKDAQGRSLYNPYTGSLVSWQIRETVEGFLARTKNVEKGFIRVANPYAPPRWKPAWETYSKAGEERLRMFTDFIKFYGYGNEADGKRDLGNIITERAEVMRNLTRLADACKLRAGKWLLYIPPDRVEEVWRKIATATVKNELGSEAGLRRGGMTSRPQLEGGLVKVYSRDFRDKAEAARLLEKLEKLGALDPNKEYYYKSDALSHLNLYAHNQWGLKTSLVSIRYPWNLE